MQQSDSESTESAQQYCSEAGLNQGIPHRAGTGETINDQNPAASFSPDADHDKSSFIAQLSACTQILTSAAPQLSSTPEGDVIAVVAQLEVLSRRVEQLQTSAARLFEANWSTGAVTGGSSYRNAAEQLGAIAMIDPREAKRRLNLAAAILPDTSLTGEVIPARLPHLGEAFAQASVSFVSACTVVAAIERCRPHASVEALEAMDQGLAEASTSLDSGIVRALGRRWIANLEADAAEPDEEELALIQGAFIRKSFRGLHRVELITTTPQFESLMTVMNAATNPRLENRPENGCEDGHENNSPELGERAAQGSEGFEDRRSRAQKLLDGLVGACNIATSTGRLPRNGGLRPVVLATIDYKQLLAELHTGSMCPTSAQRPPAFPDPQANPEPNSPARPASFGRKAAAGRGPRPGARRLNIP